MQRPRQRRPAPRPGPRKRTLASASARADFIRVVPLHHAEPAATTEDRAAFELFTGKPYVAATPQLTHRGGALLTNVGVHTIFWGKSWGTTATSTSLMQKLNDFFKAILVSPLLEQLAEYGVPGKKIGHGSWLGTKVISAGAPAQSVTDTTLRARLETWTTAGTIPKPTKNTLYFVFLEPGIVSILGGSRSCQSFCGYHNDTGNIFYAVMPYPSCAGCRGGMSAFDALTGTSSHELCEAITDPVPGSGWYDDTHGEIGDICAWHFKKVAGYTVQMEWSNQKNKCV